MIAILILAAGTSSRMRGVDKLLELIDGKPVLAVLVSRALTLGPTLVTLPRMDHPRASVVPVGATIVAVDGQMSDSIKAGIATLPDTATGVMILPADMPDIAAADMATIHAAARKTGAPIVRAQTTDGRPGHPIYFAASEFPKFADLTGDRGGYQLTKDRQDETVFVPLQGDRARLDLDTPEDWAAYRAR
jgi:CTP:molybdopterin cytidylyltransferase MocA